ncbi:MAG: hypothetical protein KatS3mg104_2001 [Phycisphaerae bacterium]|jgi:hypothetical protein|nr:MAG: hypothetical protein KatS3mg104_2001 [Phycisphaerae bacterium]
MILPPTTLTTVPETVKDDPHRTRAPLPELVRNLPDAFFPGRDPYTLKDHAK